jgi:hypothetical protein
VKYLERQLLHAVAGVTVMFLVATSSHGQSSAEEQPRASNGSASMDSVTLGYRLEGKDVPKFYAVQHFLGIVYSRAQAEDQRLFSALMRDLGLEGLGSEAALRRTAERAYKLLFGAEGSIVVEREFLVEGQNGSRSVSNTLEYGRGPQLDAEGNSAVATEEQAKANQSQKARDIADVYVDLIREIREQGASAEGVGRYISESITPTMSLGSDEPLDEPRDYVLVFEERMRERGFTELPSTIKNSNSSP